MSFVCISLPYLKPFNSIYLFLNKMSTKKVVLKLFRIQKYQSSVNIFGLLTSSYTLWNIFFIYYTPTEVNHTWSLSPVMASPVGLGLWMDRKHSVISSAPIKYRMVVPWNTHLPWDLTLAICLSETCTNK